MNGTGRGGIRAEPGGGLVAIANTLVSLSIRSISGSSILQSARYDEVSVEVPQNSFTLKILFGVKRLTLTCRPTIPRDFGIAGFQRAPLGAI